MTSQLSCAQVNRVSYRYGHYFKTLKPGSQYCRWAQRKTTSKAPLYADADAGIEINSIPASASSVNIVNQASSVLQRSINMVIISRHSVRLTGKHK